jgi:hypothetical protein
MTVIEFLTQKGEKCESYKCFILYVLHEKMVFGTNDKKIDQWGSYFCSLKEPQELDIILLCQNKYNMTIISVS